MTHLSDHFTIDEFTLSQTAARLGISNDPPPEVISHLQATAMGMELVREALSNVPILISSAFRCDALERVVSREGYLLWCRLHNHPENEDSWRLYIVNKQHPRGEACDFTAPTFGNPADVMRHLADSDVPYDQIILEFGRWVHISFSLKNRRQALIIDHSGTRKWSPT